MRFYRCLDNLYLQIALITGVVQIVNIKWARRNVGFINHFPQLFYYHVRATGRYAPNFRRITAFALRAHPLVGDKFSSVKRQTAE